MTDVMTSPRRGLPWPLLGWFGASATLMVPQAAGPVAFSLLALALTGDTQGGAALVLAMTLAQVAGAVPVTRWGRGRNPTAFLRLLVLGRTLALGGVALAGALGAPFWLLVVLAALSGSVAGAAYGYLRSLLSHLTPEDRYPRALGIAATLNEVTFVAAPVAAAGLGALSPVLGLAALTLIGALPVLLVPRVAQAEVPGVATRGSLLTARVLLWLACAAGGGAAVAVIEIGAVALALKFGQAPTMAILFTVPLCLASICGGIWVSVRNRMAGRGVVVAQLAVTALGVALVAWGGALAPTLAGAVLVGAVMPPLGTTYMLVLDRLVPKDRRAEAFAVLRTANALGVILASGLLALVSLPAALLAVVSLPAALLAVALLMGAVMTLVALTPGAMGA